MAVTASVRHYSKASEGKTGVRRNRKRALVEKLWPAALCLAACHALHAESIELQTVLATVPGKPTTVPESLKKFKAALLMSTYSKFSDSGVQTVTLSTAAPKSSATIGKYTLELTQQPDSKIEVVVKEGGKTVLTPLTYTFTKERTKQLELAAPGGMYIVFLTKPKE